MSQRGAKAALLGFVGSILAFGIFEITSKKANSQGMATPQGSGTASGSNTGDVTIGTANGLSISGQALSFGLTDAGVQNNFGVGHNLDVVGDGGVHKNFQVDGTLTAPNISATEIGGQCYVDGNIIAGNGALYSSVGNTMYVVGKVANGGTAVAVGSGNTNDLTTAGSKIHVFYRDVNTTEEGAVTNTGFFIQPVQTVTVGDDGAGTSPASTITPTSNQIKLAYNDANNASVGTISETGAQAGTVIYITHTGSGGTVVFTEIGGQQEIGGTACTLGLSDTLSAIYVNSSWHFLTCRDN